MAAPFYNAIKGTTSGTPGTGAFTPNAASTGFIAWSEVYPGWHGLVRFEDGSAWELSYCYWDGTTLSRGTGQLFASSTGSVLTLTSAATAALIGDGDRIQPNIGSLRHSAWQAAGGSTSLVQIGLNSPSNIGTAASGSLANTNFLTEQPRVQTTSATTANAQAGHHDTNSQFIYSTAAGRGGFEYLCRTGWSQLPTGPRMFFGVTDSSFSGQTVEPSAFTQNFAVIGKDSTDTNFQFITNDAGVTAGKTDTGIAPVANGWYHFHIWSPPGGAKVRFRLVREDTGAIFIAERTTDLPANGSTMKWNMVSGLNGTNTGTAIIQHTGGGFLRSGNG